MRQGSSTVYYLLGDHLGSTSVTANSSGSKAAELRYHPWGGTRFSSGTTPTARRYTGQIEDAAIGLYFYNARYYDPALGRFIQADTIIPAPANPQSLNRYAYVLNHPLRYTDPTGHMPYPNDGGPGREVPFWSRNVATGLKVAGLAVGLCEWSISLSGTSVQATSLFAVFLDGPSPILDTVGAGKAYLEYKMVFDPLENVLGGIGFGLTFLADVFEGYNYVDTHGSVRLEDWEWVLGQNTVEDFRYAFYGFAATQVVPLGIIDLGMNSHKLYHDFQGFGSKPTMERRIPILGGSKHAYEIHYD